MGKNKEIDENLYGCVSVGACMVVLIVCCLLLALCSCKPSQKIIEVEKWQHDTTTVVDTVRVIDTKIQHDSVFIKEYITEYKRDTTITNVNWKYYTYDSIGNISSLLDYASSTQHGSSTQASSENTSTSVGQQAETHEEVGGHSESSGHSDFTQGKEQVKVGLNKWQKFVMLLGYIFLVLLGCGIAFGGMRLYGKIKKR